jgi:hypothetical protein
MFCDPIFKPDKRSLTFSGKTDLNFVQWMRPQEIRNGPVFYDEGNSRFDVKQVFIDKVFVSILCLLNYFESLDQNVISCFGKFGLNNVSR